MIFFNFAFKTGMPGGDDAAESPEKVTYVGIIMAGRALLSEIEICNR